MICFLTTFRGNDGAERGDGESRSRPALRRRTCFARQDKRRHTLASGVVDGEYQPCTRRRSFPDTCLLCASPYRLPTILLLAFPAAISLWQNQRESWRTNHATRHCRRRTAEHSS